MVSEQPYGVERSSIGERRSQIDWVVGLDLVKQSEVVLLVEVEHGACRLDWRVAPSPARLPEELT